MLMYNDKQWGEHYTKFHNQYIFSYVNLIQARGENAVIISGRFLTQFSTFLDFSNFPSVIFIV